MATWYYTKDGATFGPYSNEVMIDLITRGDVTFVTLVWDAETSNAGKDWLYAYDTPLASYFTNTGEEGETQPPQETPPAEKPSPAQPTSEPAPVSRPEPLSQPDTKAPAGEKKKISIAIKIFLAVFIIGLLIGVAIASYKWYTSQRSPNADGTTKNALPSMPTGDTIPMTLTNLNVPRSTVSGLGGVISALMSSMTLGGKTERDTTISGLTSAFDGFGDLAEATREISLLAVPTDNPALYLSLLVKGDAIDMFMSRSGTLYTTDKWDATSIGGTGWVVRVPLVESPSLYVLKRPAKNNDDTVYIANSEKAISDMVSSSEGRSPRFAPTRETSGSDFLQIKLQNGLTYGAMAQAFSFNPAVKQLMTKNWDKIMWTISEVSWTKNGNSWTSESYSDFFQQNPEFIANGVKSAEEPKIFGDGELAYFMAFDAGFATRLMFQDGYNLGGASQFAGANSAIIEELRPILENSRVTMLCTEKDGKTRTAYMMLETDASDSLDKLYQTYSPLTAMLGGGPAKLEGWDSAVSMTIPLRGGPSANIVLALKNGALLAGIGDIEDFSKNITVKKAYSEYLSKDNVMNVILSSKIYDILLGLMETMPSGIAKNDANAKTATNGMKALRSSFDAICGNIKSSGKSNSMIILTEGSDPIMAITEFFPEIARSLPGQ
jgi:hypothetical protein